MSFKYIALVIIVLHFYLSKVKKQSRSLESKAFKVHEMLLKSVSQCVIMVFHRIFYNCSNVEKIFSWHN